jgi:hypothetical protein
MPRPRRCAALEDLHTCLGRQRLTRRDDASGGDLGSTDEDARLDGLGS